MLQERLSQKVRRRILPDFVSSRVSHCAPAPKKKARAPFSYTIKTDSSASLQSYFHSAEKKRGLYIPKRPLAPRVLEALCASVPVHLCEPDTAEHFTCAHF